MAYELAAWESDVGQLSSFDDEYMKNHVVVLAVSLLASACVGAPAPDTVVPTTSAAPRAASSAAATNAPTLSARPVAYRVLSSVPGRATVSPDGRWIVAPKASAGRSPFELVQLFTIDGTFVRDLTDGVFWSWLPDSSGIFVALMVPQRAPPLTIVDLDGRVITTELLLAQQTLSRDGRLVVAGHQEGCCVSIIQREIRVARRDGSGTRTLVTSQVPSEPQTVALLGVDASDRAVYRDGTRIGRIPLAGGATTTLATSADYARVIPGNTSPDGTAILARGYEPARWFVIANDRVTAWDDSLDLIVEDGAGPAKGGRGPMWIGPHVLLAQDRSGSLFAVDALTLARAPQTGRLVSGDVALAYQSGTLLVARGAIFVVLDTRTGAVRDTGLDLRPFGGPGFQVAALPAGGFLLSNDTATYRID